MSGMAANVVWISRIRQSATEIFGFSCAQREKDRRAFVDLIVSFESGHRLPEGALPEVMWSSDASDSRKKTLPHMFMANGFLAVSDKMAEVLRRFDLGPSELHPVRLLRMDRQTPYPGEHFLFQIRAQKEGFEPDYSRRFKPKRYTDQTHWASLHVDARDDDVSMNGTVLQGPDVWQDPRLLDMVFFSDRLMAAMREAKVLGRMHIVRAPVIRPN